MNDPSGQLHHDQYMARQGMSSKLAGNMTIDEQSQRQGSQTRAGVVMQVNKYVPHYQRIPQKFDKRDFKMFDYGPEGEQTQDQYNKMKMFIEEFDKVIIDTLMIDRETKFNSMFRSNIMTNADLPSVAEFNNPLETENEVTSKKPKASKALADYDSDDERENANLMFINDLQCIRKYFI